MVGEGGSTFPSGDGERDGDFVFHVTVFPGDFNRDNLVDGVDFGIWNEHQVYEEEDCDIEHGDANGDCIINGDDFALWYGNIFTDWTGLPSRPMNLEDVRRMIDELIVQYGVLRPNGTVNPTASVQTWRLFASDVARVFDDFAQTGNTSGRPTGGDFDQKQAAHRGAFAIKWSSWSMLEEEREDLISGLL